jgi:hypothetical protein
MNDELKVSFTIRAQPAPMGVDHTRLIYRYQGRGFQLTDVEGHLVKPILA